MRRIRQRPFARRAVQIVQTGNQLQMLVLKQRVEHLVSPLRHVLIDDAEDIVLHAGSPQAGNVLPDALIRAAAVRRGAHGIMGNAVAVQ